MSSVQAESVIKSIIREIGTECSSRGVEASETLIAFTVKAAVLDPDNAFNVDRALTKADVQQLIQVNNLFLVVLSDGCVSIVLCKETARIQFTIFGHSQDASSF